MEQRHLFELELIELAAGVLDPPRRSAGQAHLETCADCRRRYAALAGVHQTLAGWPAPKTTRDLWPGIEQALGRPSILRPAWRRVLATAGRAAAAILAAALVGHAAGRVVPHRAQTTVVTAPEASAEDVARSLHLAVFGADLPAGLAQPMLDLIHMETQEAAP